MNLFPTSQLVLKKQNSLFELIFKNQLRWWQALELLLLSLVGLALYGLVISTVVPDGWHAVTLLWKMIVLIWGSILLCVPSLYVFSSIRGASVTIRQLLGTVLSSIATTALVVCSLAPIVGFFIWTALDLDFIRLMNGFVIGLGLLFGLVLIGRAFGFFHKQSTNQGLNEKSARDILALWFIVVCIVVVQMGVKLGSWYHLESNVCMGDRCFPSTPIGTLTTQPTIEVNTAGDTATVAWTTPDCPNASHDVQYVFKDTIYGTGGNCTLVDGQEQCTADLTGIGSRTSGTKLNIQTHDYCGADAAVISPVVTYVKP